MRRGLKLPAKWWRVASPCLLAVFVGELGEIQSCPELAQQVPKRCAGSQHSTLARVRPMLARCGPSLTKAERLLPRCCLVLGDTGPTTSQTKLALGVETRHDLGRFCPTLAAFWPESGHAYQTWARVRPMVADFGRDWPVWVRLRPVLAGRPGFLRVNYHQNSARVLPMLTRFDIGWTSLPGLAGIGKALANIVQPWSILGPQRSNMCQAWPALGKLSQILAKLRSHSN